MKIIMNDELFGSYGIGKLGCGYDDIVAVFGKPNIDGDGEKVQYEWGFIIDGIHACIYDYEWMGTDAKSIDLWSVGGESHTNKVLHLITTALGLKKVDHKYHSNYYTK